MRIALFKQKGPKGFRFKPRFYDADHEELQARIESVKREMEAEKNGQASAHGGEGMRAKMRANRNYYEKSSAMRKSSNYRVFIIAGILAIAAYLFLTLDFNF